MTLRMSELSFKTEVEVVIELIQVYNWEIRRHHSTICRCELVDILYFSIFP